MCQCGATKIISRRDVTLTSESDTSTMEELVCVGIEVQVALNSYVFGTQETNNNKKQQQQQHVTLVYVSIRRHVFGGACRTGWQGIVHAGGGAGDPRRIGSALQAQAYLQRFSRHLSTKVGTRIISDCESSHYGECMNIPTTWRKRDLYGFREFKPNCVTPFIFLKVWFSSALYPIPSP